MVGQIDSLRETGFSDEEISDWAQGERSKMNAAGFGDKFSALPDAKTMLFVNYRQS